MKREREVLCVGKEEGRTEKKKYELRSSRRFLTASAARLRPSLFSFALFVALCLHGQREKKKEGQTENRCCVLVVTPSLPKVDRPIKTRAGRWRHSEHLLKKIASPSSRNVPDNERHDADVTATSFVGVRRACQKAPLKPRCWHWHDRHFSLFLVFFFVSLSARYGAEEERVGVKISPRRFQSSESLYFESVSATIECAISCLPRTRERPDQGIG